MVKKELLINYHKVQPIRALNKYNSRFAYKIFIKGKPIAGEWELIGTNVNKGTFIYKKLKEKKR